jgi:hypothetical protein
MHPDVSHKFTVNFTDVFQIPKFHGQVQRFVTNKRGLGPVEAPYLKLIATCFL